MEGTPTAVVPATPVTITAAARVNVNQLAVRQQLDVKEPGRRRACCPGARCTGCVAPHVSGGVRVCRIIPRINT